MWQQAAKWLQRFPESVLTAISADGYLVGVRQTSRSNDAGTGEMPVSFPRDLVAMPGRANVLAHQHDENLWNLNAIQIKGLMEVRGAGRVFLRTSFNNPPSFGQLRSLWRPQKDLQRSVDRYLAKRGFGAPPTLTLLTQLSRPSCRRSVAYLSISSAVMWGMSLSGPTLAVRTSAWNTSVGAAAPRIGLSGLRNACSRGRSEC